MNGSIEIASEKAEFDLDMAAHALPYIRRLGLGIWHAINACSCDQGWFLPGIPCEIGLEELAEERRCRYFYTWDAIGLGYIGP